MLVNTKSIFSLIFGPVSRAPQIVKKQKQYSGFGKGGGQEFFFSDLGICMSRSNMLRMALPCALLGGFGGMLPREVFFKTVQFGAF